MAIWTKLLDYSLKHRNLINFEPEYAEQAAGTKQLDFAPVTIQEKQWFDGRFVQGRGLKKDPFFIISISLDTLFSI